MIENPEVENQDRYKSYIQRRRVIPDDNSAAEYDSDNEDTSLTKNFSETETRTRKEKSAMADIEELSILREKYRSDEGFLGYGQKTEEKSTSLPFKLFSPQIKNDYRKDNNTYRRYPSSSHGYSPQANRAPVEDNHTTLLAIKIIKQALACFVMLGIVVLMQQNVDMVDELSFVRKHVVENHIEVSNIITGVENIIAECSRFFGGSP